MVISLYPINKLELLMLLVITVSVVLVTIMTVINRKLNYMRDNLHFNLIIYPFLASLSGFGWSGCFSNSP